MKKFLSWCGKHLDPLVATLIMICIVFAYQVFFTNGLMAKNSRLFDENELLKAEIQCRREPNTDFLGENYSDEHIGKYIEMVGIAIRYINMLETDIQRYRPAYMGDVAYETDEWLDFMETVVNPIENGDCPAFEDYWSGLESKIDSLALEK